MRQVRERRRADVLADLLDRSVARDHLVGIGEVDAVEALPDHRRRRDAHVHLGRARVEEHLHDLPRRVAADDRVVDDDDALARDLGERVELQLHALAAQRLVGLDERARDVAVLDQPFAERDAESRARSRSPRACPSRGSAGRGRPRPAPPWRAARPSARARRAPRCRRAACRGARDRRTRRCRARRAPAGSTACTLRSPFSSISTASPRSTSRTNSAPTRSSAHVSDATTQSS